MISANSSPNNLTIIGFVTKTLNNFGSNCFMVYLVPWLQLYLRDMSNNILAELSISKFWFHESKSVKLWLQKFIVTNVFILALAKKDISRCLSEKVLHNQVCQ